MSPNVFILFVFYFYRRNVYIYVCLYLLHKNLKGLITCKFHSKRGAEILFRLQLKYELRRQIRNCARRVWEKSRWRRKHISNLAFQPGLKFRFDYMEFFSDISARLPGMKILYRFFKLLARAEVIRHFYFFWIYAVIIYDLNIFFILLLLFILVNLVWNRRENYKKIVLTQFPLSREIRHMRLVRMRDSACGELRESVMVF